MTDPLASPAELRKAAENLDVAIRAREFSFGELARPLIERDRRVAKTLRLLAEAIEREARP